MKKFFISVFIFFLPFAVKAASITSISPTHVTPGETQVTINGTGFGNSSSGKYIYFGYSPVYSISWTDTRIVVKAPYDLYSSGKIKISGSFSTGETCSYGYCYDNTEWQDLTSQSYYLKPKVSETTKRVHNNGDFEIVGEYFGSTQGTVKIGGNYCRIIEWQSNYIKCEVPELYSKSSVVAYSIKVPDSNNYSLSGQVDYLPKISNDTYSYYQTYLKQIGVTDIWDKYSGNGVKIAVIDSGVDINNPDLKYSLWVNYGEILNNNIDDDGNGFVDDYYGYNFIDDDANMSPKNNHGTFVAGIIAASRDNNTGIAGIAPNAKIMSLIACDDYGCSSDDVVNAIKYAVDNGANIINLSLGGKGSLGYSPVYDNAIQYAYDKNVLVVVSAGNGDTEGNGTRGQDMDKIKASPVCNEKDSNMILGVGAINNDSEPTIWTNYSMKYVDISAPGVDVFSTAVPLYTNDYWYDFESGTSFSAPMVVGVAALLKEKNPSWKNFELISQIISRSDKFKNNWNVYGRILNAKNIIGMKNPQAELTGVYPKIINKDSSILHIYGNNFYRNIQIKFYNNQFNGYIPNNLMTVSENEIQIDLSKWTYILPFTGIFSLKVDSDNSSSYSDRKKYLLNNAVEIKEITQNNNTLNKEVNIPEENIDTNVNIKNDDNLDVKKYIETQKKLIKKIDQTLSNKLSGKILLQVEDNGEGWYVNPENKKRYFLGRPSDAFNIMRELGLGISNKDFDSFNGYASKRLSGKILLKVEDAGKAYYVNPVDLKMHYLGRPADAFQVMRDLGLGITNNDIVKIDIS